MTRLFGRICDPSTAELGVAKWIALLADTHVSLSALSEKNSPNAIQDISGRQSRASYPKYSRPSASSRTSPDIYDLASSQSQMTYAQWVIALRQACLQRRKSARRTDGKGSLSWPTAMETGEVWPTILANAGKGASSVEVAKENPRGRLDVAARLWRTPMASDGTGGAQEFFPGKNMKLTLRDQAATLASRSGRPCQMTRPVGIKFPYRLNPSFCEWLMGWPIGWTEPEPAGTELCRWSRRMRGEFSRLASN
jgi:hypothetical protein